LDGYNQLIDLALDMKDFKWVEELVKKREENKAKQREVKPSYPEAKALEDLNDPYVVKEDYGLRNIIFSSEDDISYANIVELKNYSYDSSSGVYIKQNEQTQYKQLDEANRTAIRCYLLGYAIGVRYGSKIKEYENANRENKFVKFLLKKFNL
jgi:hypothetical protein